VHVYHFEKLEVWQNARKFSKEVYLATDSFPEKERFGITNQMRRASLSIAANIAEGMSRNSDRDKLRFINFSYSSAIEVLNFLIIGQDLDYLAKADYIRLREQAGLITNQLNALTRKLKG